MANLKGHFIFPLLLLSFFTLILVLFPLSPASAARGRFPLHNPFPPPPRIAYFIAGSASDGPRVFRLLQAAYHPRNYYLLHLDLRATNEQRNELAKMVGSSEVFDAAGNVDMIGKSNPVREEGCTPLALLLQAAAILLRSRDDWDWFVNLGASDYPLIPQDDFLHVMSYVPRDINFIEHSSNPSWKEYQRIMDIVVDPGLYLETKGRTFTGNKKRSLPDAYRFFTGSPHVILSRKLVEYSIVGWDNLPRTLLLFFSNTKFSQRDYFQTLVCNTKDFSTKVVNSNLRFTEWDSFSRKEPRNFSVPFLEKMLGSGAVFAGKFRANDPVLDRIDSIMLKRGQGKVSPGAWCLGGGWGHDPCRLWGDISILRPGPASKMLEKLLLKLMDHRTSRLNRCVCQLHPATDQY
ncbi:hypothetical protein NMG60_11012508 [Bertholletia excelsa]